jgi:hypothetical protein
LTAGPAQAIPSGDGERIMWNLNPNLPISAYDNGIGASGFGLAHGPGIDLRPDLLGIDLTHRIDVADVASARVSGGKPGGGGGGGTTSFPDYVSGATGGYNITIQFKGSWTQDYYNIFKNAADYLTGVIADDIQNVSVRMKGTLLSVDDIVITAELGNIDGVGGILGQAGPTSIRTSGYLPATASMKFDIADAAVYLADGLFNDIILHEMMHSLGFGSIWGYKGLVTDGLYTGAEAVSEYGQPIPVETDGGSGTAGAHWDDTTFGSELMTGYISATNYLSGMSIGALADLGYGLGSDSYAQYASAGTTFLLA